ncbi:DNA-methyltransferase [Mycoplasma sp. 4423]
MNSLEKIINKIHLGNNLDLFKQIPDKSIDLIFADPPYNMNLQKQLYRYDGSVFDGVNDAWDKYESLEHYDTETKKWLIESLRVLKDSGSLWVIGSYQNIHRLGYLLQDLGAWIINEIVWEKSNPVPNFAGTRFVNAQETLLWVTKTKNAKYTFNYKTMKHLNGNLQMKSIWRFPICNGNERLKDVNGKKIHSTQKPLVLLERIILATSNVGDVILDPFSGTGTTAHAAKKLGRNYIAFEQDPKYYQASVDRLASVTEDNDHNDLKFAIYDHKPNKVTFKELISNGYLDIKIPIRIYNFQQDLYFNNQGQILYNNVWYTPNALCKKLFNKPTNAWENISYQGEKLSSLREKYRQEN